MEAPVQSQPQYPAQDRCSERIFKLLAFAGLLGVLVLIHFLDPGFYHQIVHLARGGNIQETVDFLRSFGPWAVVISFLMDVFINAAGCLPSIFLSTANGVVFGLPVGILVSWSVETVIAKSNNLQKLDEMSSENGLVAMALARTLPYFPSGILTCLGAISRMKFRDYVIATFIGKLPSTALEVVVGHDIVHFHQHMDRLAILVTLVLLVYGTLLYSRYRKHRA